MNIHTEKFEGPLDLLLAMIEEEKLDITEVSLAKIADQYIQYIENNKNIDPEEVANFLVIAARLLLIKSKTLLPYLIKDEDEEEIQDFANQLKIYKDFLEASRVVEKILEKRNFMHGRDMLKLAASEKGVFYPPPNVSKGILHSIFQEVVNMVKPPEVLEEDTIIKSISIDEKIALIKEALKKLKQVSFNSLLEKKGDRINVIINFIALLELMKQKSISAQQKILFGDIQISRM